MASLVTSIAAVHLCYCNRRVTTHNVAVSGSLDPSQCGLSGTVSATGCIKQLCLGLRWVTHHHISVSMMSFKVVSLHLLLTFFCSGVFLRTSVRTDQCLGKARKSTLGRATAEREGRLRALRF